MSARIYLQGPLGYDLNVALQRREKKVSLRSSIADAELFKEVARPFNKLHDLKEYEAEARNAAGEEQKKPSFLGSWQTQLVGLLGFLLAVVTLFLNTVQVPKTTLTLNLPKDGEEITGRSSPVRWSLSRKTVFKGEFPVPTRAHITVAKEGESGYQEDLPNASPGDAIHFPTDGTYDITVSVPGSNEGNARVMVKAAARAVGAR